MVIYFMVDALVIILGLIFIKKKIKIGSTIIAGENVFIFLSALILIFISSFRGDFSTDYSGYVDIFYRFANASFNDILKRGIFEYPEKGYLLFQSLITTFFHKPVYIFIFSSVIIVLSNLMFLKRYSLELLLAVMLFIDGGIYYSSFNIMRQFLAASIVLLGSGYLFNRKLIPYTVVVLVASMIHISAIVMILFYFFSTVKIKKEFSYLYIMCFIVIAGTLPFIIDFVCRYHWSWYHQGASFMSGYNWKNIVMPTFIFTTAFGCYLMNRKSSISIEESNINGIQRQRSPLKNVICMNASFLYFTFALLGMQMRMLDRFVSFFAPYMICFFCEHVHKNKYRKVIITGTICILVLYGLVTKDNFPYYFIWNK